MESLIAQGSWKVVEGSGISVRMMSDDPVHVVHQATSSHIIELTFIHFLIGLIVWLVGLLVGAIAFS